MSGVRWLRHSELVDPHDALTPLAEAPVIFTLPWLDRGRAQAACEVLMARAGLPFLLLAIEDDLGAGPNAIWNSAFARTRGACFGYLDDDAFPGRQWLAIGLRALARSPQAELLAFNDGKWFGQLAGFGLARRDWVAALYGGSLFHPRYRRHYGDTELTLIARQQQALAYDPHALLIEVDAAKDRKPVETADRTLFATRRAAGFEGRVSDPALLALFG